MTEEYITVTFKDESSDRSAPALTLLGCPTPHVYQVLKLVTFSDYGHPISIPKSTNEEVVVLFDQKPLVGQLIPAKLSIQDQHRLRLVGIKEASIVIYGGGGRPLKTRLKQIKYS